MAKKKTREEFIEKAREVYGDKYDYSKVEYTKSVDKVLIICPKHGEFWQVARSHVKGFEGCKACNGIFNHTPEQFIKKSREVHGDKYDYSKVEYTNCVDKVLISCPEHGEFWQEARRHMEGNGCPVCGGRIRRTQEEFIKEARKVHGDKYDYSKAQYISRSKHMLISCPEHGEFWQTGAGHLKGRGCRICAGFPTNSRQLRHTTETFVALARKTHGEKYDYSKTEYINNETSIVVICPEHGEFWQVARNHAQSNGCPVCRESSGEREIRLYLETNQIIKKSQYSFKGSTIKRQKFDFATRFGVIEYQGRPHYRPTSFGKKGKHAKFEMFKDYIRRDHNKLQWCQKHNIPLLIIPYWDRDRIPEILDDLFAGKTPTFSEPPKIVNRYKSMRKKIREHLKIKREEVLCGLINS